MSSDRPPFHEGPADTGQDHLSMDEIADLDEGLLAPERTSAARAHLQRCDECSARARALADTTTALRGLGPICMPTDVAQRLETAIAAESEAVSPRLHAVPSGAPEPAIARGQATTVVPDLGEVRARRTGRPSLAASAAAVVAILAISAIVIGHGGGHHNPSLQGANAPGQTLNGAVGASQSVRPVSTGRTYTPTNLASLVPGLLEQQTPASGGSTAAGLPVPGASSPDRVGAAGAGTAASGAGTTSAGTGAATNKHNGTQPSGSAPTAAAVPRTQFAPLTTSATVPSALARYRTSGAALIDCAQRFAPTLGAVPEVVDFGRWTNKTASPPIRHEPALILVFADPVNSGAVDVDVVAAGCDNASLLTYKQVSVPG